MNAALIFTSAVALILLLALSLLLTKLLELRSQRSRLAVLLQTSADDQLEAAVRRLYQAAATAAQTAPTQTRFAQLLAHCPLPALVLDQNRVIIDLSAQAEQELDQPRRQRGLLETLGNHELEQAAHQALSTLEPASLTVRLYAQGRRPYRTWLFPYDNGAARECLIFLEDASDTMDYGELRSQFAANVSHELRTPLAGIKVMVESLQDPGIDSVSSAKFLKSIERETGRLEQLITEILFLSSLESGAAGLAGESELEPLVTTVFENLAPVAARFEAELKQQIPPRLTLPLPERMATTIVTNLVENAIKYSGRGSTIEVWARQEEDTVSVGVKDNGIGISAEHLPHIFERFYRVDRSRSRRLGGTGLGLSIVKHIVESAGGEIKAQSREGFGTEISFSLPRKD